MLFEAALFGSLVWLYNRYQTAPIHTNVESTFAQPLDNAIQFRSTGEHIEIPKGSSIFDVNRHVHKEINHWGRRQRKPLDSLGPPSQIPQRAAIDNVFRNV